MRKCEGCGEQISDDFAFCPYCGEPKNPLCVEFHDEELQRKIGSILSGTERRLQAVIAAFSRYIEAPVVDTIISGDLDRLRGERRRVTVLHSDIRNSSGMIARLEPEDALQFLGEHHERMAAAVQAYNGLLDKFIGDGMMAIFSEGEPEEQALQAARAALMMRQYVRETSDDWPVPDIPFQIGVSINSGEAVIGSVGSRYRQDYTAIGAEINYVDDLQQACKDFCRDIIVSTSTRNLLGDDAEVEEVGSVARPPHAREEPVFFLRDLIESSQEESQ